jgi:hypothetical protein
MPTDILTLAHERFKRACASYDEASAAFSIVKKEKEEAKLALDVAEREAAGHREYTLTYMGCYNKPDGWSENGEDVYFVRTRKEWALSDIHLQSLVNRYDAWKVEPPNPNIVLKPEQYEYSAKGEGFKP